MLVSVPAGGEQTDCFRSPPAGLQSLARDLSISGAAVLFSVHRPGLELARLTPQNIHELLFDDVMWARKAKEEHDVFAEALRDKGVRCTTSGRRWPARSAPVRGSGRGGDTVMSMVDRSSFVLYPYFDRDLRSWTVTAGDGDDQLRVSLNPSLWQALATALQADEVKVLTADEDIRAAEREQWDDGSNYLAVAPGVVVGYDRNAGDA